MNEKKDQLPQTPNDEHNRQTFWQIYFPILLAIVAAVASLFVLLGKPATGIGSLRVWADISGILIILPTLLIFLLMTALTLLGSFATHKTSQSLKIGFGKAQHLATRISHTVISVSKSIQRALVEVEVISSAFSQRLFK